MTDKVQFQTNVPGEVTLKYEDRKDVTGQYGDQVLYTIAGGRVMYVPPIESKLTIWGSPRASCSRSRKRRKRTARDGQLNGR